MSYRKPSSEFNRLFAEAFVDHFGDGFVAVEDDKDEDESLLFRGPHPDDHSRLTTHVIVALQEDVRASIEIAAPNSRAEMIKNLIRNLGTQLRATYDPKDLRTFAKRIEGRRPSCIPPTA
jgi:hypothetical protein